MLRDLQKDLKHLSSLAFRRSAHCAPLLKKFHALKTQIAAATDPGLIWNIYDWLLVPLSLWPLDFEGLASHILTAIENGKDAFHSVPNSSSSSIQHQASSIFDSHSTFSLLHFIDPPPSIETQLVVAGFEHDIESGRYEKMLKQSEKFDEQEKALLQNEQLAAEWAELKRLFDIKQFQNARGVIRRRMSQERGFRDPSWQFAGLAAPTRPAIASERRRKRGAPLSAVGEDQGEVVPSFKNQNSKIENPSGRTSLVSKIENLSGFHFFFDAFCYRWKLYGMEHDRPLLLKISVNPTPHGTMIVIPRHWSLDPRRDLDWSLINRLHRSRGAKKQGPKLSPARIQKLDEAKQVKALREKARKLKLKGEALHDFICVQMHRDPRSDSSWWKRLLRNQKSQFKNR
jgi:hypothetical protein